MCFLRRLRFETDLRNLPLDKQRTYRSLFQQGPEKHVSSFRDYLLRYRGEPFDTERYLDFSAWAADDMGSYAMIPPLIASWTAYSRRVMRLSADLQVQLELTSISNLRWEDVRWPYDAFLIGLDRPIEVTSGRQFDYIMVSTRPAVSTDSRLRVPDLTLMLLPTNLEHFPFLTEKKLRRIGRLIEADRVTSLNAEIIAYNKKYGQHRHRLPVGEIRFYPQERIVDVLDEFHERSDVLSRAVAELDIALRVSVGLAMYLASVPPSPSVLQDEAPTAPADPDIRAISQGAHVCRVLSSYTMSIEERHEIMIEGVPRQFRQLSPHWRRGHFRREWGQGSNPKARRTVWIHPVQVRKDLLGPHQQVGGSDTTIPAGATSTLSQFHRRRIGR